MVPHMGSGCLLLVVLHHFVHGLTGNQDGKAIHPCKPVDDVVGPRIESQPPTSAGAQLSSAFCEVHLDMFVGGARTHLSYVKRRGAGTGCFSSDFFFFFASCTCPCLLVGLQASCEATCASKLLRKSEPCYTHNLLQHDPNTNLSYTLLSSIPRQAQNTQSPIPSNNKCIDALLPVDQKPPESL